MAKKLILHVGFHKTGTTAIQESMFVAKHELLNYRIHYPKKSSHAAAWALLEKTWGWAGRGGKKTPISKWNTLKKSVAKCNDTYVASSEFFSELSIEKIERIKSEIRADEIKIIFTLRPLAKMLSSTYQQYLKYGLKADYLTWLHEMLDQPGKSKMSPSFWNRNFHDQVILKWAKVFGEQNIAVVIADETRPNLIFDSFEQLLEVGKGTLSPQPTGGNRSLTAQECEVLLQVNENFPKGRSWGDYSVFTRYTAIAHISNLKPHPSGEKLLTPEWAVSKANEITATTVEYLAKSKIQILGNLDSLKNASVPTGEPNRAEFIDTQTVSELLLSYDQSVIRKMRWRTILKEILRRLKARLIGKSEK